MMVAQETYHIPVLQKEVVEGLVTLPEGIYVDATLGGGGHAEALLEHLGPQGRVVGIDQDPEALEVAKKRLHRFGARFKALQGNFAEMDVLLRAEGIGQVQGILLDLGVSSHQIDTAARGFSFQQEGPLDMRMNPEQPLTAADLVATASEQELTDIFRHYGEEGRAPKIARAVVQHRPIHTTAELAQIVRSVVPVSEQQKTLARVFQALRIAVNRELDVLERALEKGLELLAPGGRMAVISYHSLEDRRVKRFFRYGNFEGVPVKDPYGHLITPWKVITRKPLRPSEEEIRRNPRARSARLRIAEKIDG